MSTSICLCQQTTFPKHIGQRQYLKGLIGTRPVVDKGRLYNQFRDQWLDADPDVYHGAGNVSESVPVGLLELKKKQPTDLQIKYGFPGLS